MGMTYAFASLAGSTGKTTTVTTLGTLLARSGLRVRIIDLDSQANASHWLGYEDTHGKTIAEILRETATVAEVELPARVAKGEDEEGEPIYGEIPNLTLLPARRETLDKVMIELAAQPDGVLRLREALTQASPVDVTLIDCPGTMSTLVLSGLIATSASEDEGPDSWGVIACTTPSYKGLRGLPDLERNIGVVQRTYRLDLRLLGIVPCSVPDRSKGSVYIEQMDDLREIYGELVTPTVWWTSIVDEALANATPLPLYGRRARKVNGEYSAVLEYLKESLGIFPSKTVAA